jgi:spermidine dehydrogenase
MTSKRDRELGMGRSISRRDFLNGVSVALTSSLVPASAVAEFRRLSREETGSGSVSESDNYPPTRTGMRGSHPGSFEVAHELRDGKVWDSPEDGDGPYDLVVVGGGISGLSAAHFFRKRHGDGARILVLDNHDDFGGHAKRNEFWHDGRMYLMNGGTLNVEAPSQYSTVASGLLWELGIDRTRYYQSVERVKSLYHDLGLGYSVFFDRETFGADRLVTGYGKLPMGDFLAATPLAEKAKADLLRLYEGREDYLPGLDSDAKKQKLAHLSYRDYLLQMAKADPGVVPFLNSRPMGLFCVGIDAIPALYAWEMGFPGFSGLALKPTAPEQLLAEPGGQHGRENQERADAGDPDMYFPDGNATIARLLVRSLIPKAVPGRSMEDIVTARADYDRLDEAGSPVRIRLESTAIKVEHVGPIESAREVAVTYVRKGRAYRVRAGHAVLACWNTVIPYIWDEIEDGQKKALLDGVKAPLVYTSVLVSSWASFLKAKVSGMSAPGSYHVSAGLGPSLQLGDYRSSQDPETPIVVRMSRYPCSPGLSRREQHRVGRQELLQTSFETFERNIRDQLARSLGPSGFDPARDVLAITVNRWPHGYAYSYNSLYDPDEWAFTSSPDRPAIRGRKPLGLVAIANADAAASPHTDAAIGEAYRAVTELARDSSAHS